MSLTRELPRYQCHKKVHALKIAHLLANPRGVELHFEDERYAAQQMDALWIDRHKVEAGGYLVIYEDGYPSFSPAAVFEAGYTLIPPARIYVCGVTCHPGAENCNGYCTGKADRAAEVPA